MGNNPNEDQLSRLIRIVDEHFERRPLRLWLKNLLMGSMVIVLLVIFGVALYGGVWAISLLRSHGQIGDAETIALSLTAIASTLALGSFAFTASRNYSPERAYEDLVTFNYNIMRDMIGHDEHHWLRALIMIRSKQPEFALDFIRRQKRIALNEMQLIDVLYE
jgi:hypothetical protein